MKRIAVIGAGTMGAGIAQLAASHGTAVRLIDLREDVLARAVEQIGKRLARSVEKGRMTDEQRNAALSRIDTRTRIEDLGSIELAVEAVVEDLDVKRKVFAALEQTAPPDAVLATNTSSLPVSRIAEAVKRPARVIGMHFFNPAPVMPLVEIVAGKESDPKAIGAGVETARSWGKTPVRVQDTPGFIVNRVARGFYLEALRLLGEGVAGVDEIDAILRRHGGFRMGPFELMDLIGIDVNYAVSVSVYEQMGRLARFQPHDIQRRLVETGHIGRKAGRGFYLYEEKDKLPAVPVDRRSFRLAPMLQDVLQTFCRQGGITEANGTEQYVLGRVLGAILNEAGWALAEGIATAEDIDIAMVKGTNYPQGPLAWAGRIGHRTVRGMLKALNDHAGDGRYEPAPVFAEAS
ncbi:MAG: 3-hydroxybutyryl-CoA dehydrogenase [Planctomycetota bacterium]|nr:MAG: 3-hydroxybutyryl-CoA dehydrogenase [Planctomycetota bacterium]